ncbi:MAG TPA: hypothetical protein PK069_08000 [Methanolinea sp.]|nr:hypothetical protein [Methanolinea sp.]
MLIDKNTKIYCPFSPGMLLLPAGCRVLVKRAVEKSTSSGDPKGWDSSLLPGDYCFFPVILRIQKVK